MAHAQDDYDHLRESADQARPRRTLPCERMIWMRGIHRPCGQTFGVAIWIDATGVHHAACRHHVAELRHRYPVPA